MVAVHSQMMALGNPAPVFELPSTNLDQHSVSLEDFLEKPLLVMFICNHCPYVIRLMPELAKLGNEAMTNGFGVVAISANDVNHYPQDGPDKMRVFADDNGFEFPYLYDETQDTAKAFQAACTPDFYVFDAQHQLRYRGQMDAARPGNTLPADGADLRLAMNALLNGDEIAAQQTPSIGCNIKWKPGNQPTYF